MRWKQVPVEMKDVFKSSLLRRAWRKQRVDVDKDARNESVLVIPVGDGLTGG